MEKKRRLKYNILFFVIFGLLFILIYTFILQNNYRNNALDTAVERDIKCADAIHKVVSNKFSEEDFENMDSMDDMDSDRYKELQESLNEIRSLNSTRYLYTANMDSDGRLIYQIDGLDLDAEDFAYPGTYIEDEMIPYIEDALAGEKVYSQDIVDTTWGHIFTACYPVYASDSSGEVIGALCMEMDMEDTYSFIAKSKAITMVIELVACVLFVLMGIGIYLTMRKYRQNEEVQQGILEKAVADAESANKAKSSFLFNMSHDIRTPMNAILGYAELAEKNLDDRDKMHNYHEKIKICGQKMLSILDNVLEISRIESGKVIIEETAGEFGKVLDECMLMVQVEAQKKNLTLEVQKDAKYQYLYFDKTHLAEIVLNLVSNAIKYTGEGGKIQCIITQSEGTDDGWVNQEIIVSDNGIGMSEEFQRHIFEMFSRERSTTVSGVEGTGLGMGIVKNLVSHMNGTIEVESKLGEGSTFKVTVPCRIASYEDTQPKKAEVHVDTSRIDGVCILLAEDNDLNAEITMTLLSDEGFKIERADNGVKCVEKLEKADSNYYSLILMDIQMPIMDGYAATQKIRMLSDKSKSGIPIVAMTANAFTEDRKKAIDSGMDDYVSKPIDMNILLPVILKNIHK